MSPRILIASDGSVCGLLAAAAAARERGPGQLLCLGLGGGVPEAVVGPAVAGQAELLGHRFVTRRSTDFVRTAMEPGKEGERVTRELLDLGFLALREGMSELVWAGGRGTAVGGDGDVAATEAIAGLLGRTMLVERLVGLERPPEVSPLRMRAPYADLSDRQLADLVLDMDLPIWTCWWWALARGPRGTPEADVARREYNRWEALLKEAGWREGMPGPEVMVMNPAHDPASP